MNRLKAILSRTEFHFLLFFLSLFLFFFPVLRGDSQGRQADMYISLFLAWSFSIFCLFCVSRCLNSPGIEYKEDSGSDSSGESQTS